MEPAARQPADVPDVVNAEPPRLLPVPETAPELAHRSIGEVLALLKEEFADVTISKIRFLEAQGLIDPERTPSAYRRFYLRRRPPALGLASAARKLLAAQGDQRAVASDDR